MSRSLLYKHDLDRFLRWCAENGIETRDGRGDWQVAQISDGEGGWDVIYERLHMPMHLTVVRPLEPLVRRFLAAKHKRAKENTK